eukprot:1823666-Amphidinium_carterae.1
MLSKLPPSKLDINKVHMCCVLSVTMMHLLMDCTLVQSKPATHLGGWEADRQAISDGSMTSDEYPTHKSAGTTLQMRPKSTRNSLIGIT